ncbi:hypothetical protein ABGA98_25950 [Nonomuraea sp. B1E8]|uniref:hypothetical protein n=1 Tax=Nonomuraea sp. B1E8 TaxID=3153575 RepID=UPI00325CCE54
MIHDLDARSAGAEQQADPEGSASPATGHGVLDRIGGELADQKPHVVQKVVVGGGLRQLHNEPASNICPNIADYLGAPRKLHLAYYAHT